MKEIFFSLFLFLLAITGFSLRESIKKIGNLQEDIVYKKVNNISLKLDVYTPDGEGPFPTVIFVHGGGLRGGKKSNSRMSSIGKDLIHANYSWISIDYRLYPQAHFPDPILDVESAIRFVKTNARKYKVDVKRIVLMGSSAGGYLVSYVAVSNSKDTRVAAVVPLWGVYDYTERYEKGMQDKKFINDSLFWRDFFNVPVNGSKELFFDEMRGASTTTIIKNGLPPFLLVHSTSDSTVNYMQAVRFCDKMKAAGNTCELITVQNAKHGESTLTKDTNTIPMIIEWINKTLK